MNIPKKVIAKRINPSHTAHQSSDFIRDVKFVFKEMLTPLLLMWPFLI